MEAEEGVGSEKPAKRRRVTKACDQCGKRRRKCIREEGKACEGCVAAGKGDLCTFTKPAKRRGPLAGYSTLAKTASERVRLLELLLGDLFLVGGPNVEDLADFCLQRKTTCALAPGVIPERTESAKKNKFVASGASQWLEMVMAENAIKEEGGEEQDEQGTAGGEGEESSPNQGSTVASTTTQRFDIQDIESDVFSLFSNPYLLAARSDASDTQMDAYPSSQAPLPPPPVLSPVWPSRLHLGPSSSASLLAISSTPLFSVSNNPLPPLPVPPNDDLPSEDIINALLDEYLSHSSHNSLPILDRQLLLTWAMDHHVDEKSDLAHLEGQAIVARELIFAILATAASSMGSGSGKDPAVSVEVFKAQAERCLARAVRAPTLGTIQAGVLMAMVDLGRGDLFSASAHFGTTLNLAYALGLHDSTSRCYTAAEDQRIFYRRTFWSLIVVDTLLALRIGRCPLVPPDSYDNSLPATAGPEEVELWRPVDVEVLKAQRGDSTTNSRPSHATHGSITRLSSISTFCELVKLSLVGSHLLARLNLSASASVPIHLDDIALSLAAWEDGLASHFKVAADQRVPTHKMELQLLYLAFATLCTRPNSSAIPLSPQCTTHVLRTLSLLKTHLETNTLYQSRPVLSPILLTLASTMTFARRTPSPPVGLPAHWRTLIEATRQLAAVYPSGGMTLATICGLPQIAQPMAVVAEHKREEEASPALPPILGFGESRRGQGGMMAVDSSVEGGPMMISLVAWPDPGLHLFGQPGAGFSQHRGEEDGAGAEAMGAPSFDDIPGDLHAEQPEDLMGAFDFARWDQPDNDVLRFLGARGPTRPPSPNGGDGFDIDLVGRWSSQVDGGGWDWAEKLRL